MWVLDPKPLEITGRIQKMLFGWVVSLFILPLDWAKTGEMITIGLILSIDSVLVRAVAPCVLTILGGGRRVRCWIDRLGQHNVGDYDGGKSMTCASTSTSAATAGTSMAGGGEHWQQSPRQRIDQIHGCWHCGRRAAGASMESQQHWWENPRQRSNKSMAAMEKSTANASIHQFPGMFCF